jgi:hypothetical protein
VQDQLRRANGTARGATSPRQTQTDRVLSDAMARAEAGQHDGPAPLRALPGGTR